MSHQDKPALVIMAAGMGSRFGGLKQIAPIGKKGEPILAYSLYDAQRAGFRKFVFVIKDEIYNDFRELVLSKIPAKYDVRVVFQRVGNIPSIYSVPEGRVKPWGTSHAILAAKPVLNGPFAVINSDDYYGPGAFGPVYEFLKKAKKGQYCMMAYNVANTLSENGGVTRGVCEVKKGLLTKVVETHEITKDSGLKPDTPVSMNLWGFTKDFLTALEKGLDPFLVKALHENPLKGEYLLPDSVSDQLKAGAATVAVLRTNDRWYGVTYKEDLAPVQATLRGFQESGLYPEDLFAGK